MDTQISEATIQDIMDYLNIPARTMQQWKDEDVVSINRTLIDRFRLATVPASLFNSVFDTKLDDVYVQDDGFSFHFRQQGYHGFVFDPGTEVKIEYDDFNFGSARLTYLTYCYINGVVLISASFDFLDKPAWNLS